MVVRLGGPYRGRFQVRLLAPHPAGPRRTHTLRRRRAPLIGRAVDPGRGAGLVVRAHGHRVPADRHRPAKLVARLRGPHCRRFQIRLLAPRAPAPDEHIRRPGIGCPFNGVLLTPVVALSSAIAPTTTVSPLMATETAKVVACLSTGPHRGRFQVRLLGPHAAAPAEHIRRPGGACRQFVRRAVDSRRGAVFLGRPHHHRVPAHRHRIAEPVARLRRSLLLRVSGTLAGRSGRS